MSIIIINIIIINIKIFLLILLLLLLLLLLCILNYYFPSKVASPIATYGFSGGLLIIAMLLIKICKCYYLIK